MFKPDLIYDVVNYAWNFTLNILLFVIEKNSDMVKQFARFWSLSVIFWLQVREVFDRFPLTKNYMVALILKYFRREPDPTNILITA